MSGKPQLKVKIRKESKGSIMEQRKNSGNYTYFDTLTLRPPPSALQASVPRPRRAKVPGGLPLWNHKPLDAKLPLMQGPDGPFVFTRGKLGEKLWKCATTSDFTLSDPYGREVRFEYDPAHDGNLRHWLREPVKLEFLQKQGLVTPTPDERVACSVQQYNNYRQFLYSQYRDALRSEAERRENLRLEKMMVQKAKDEAVKETLKMKQFEESCAKRVSNLNKLEENKLVRLENCRRRLQRVLDHAMQADERKEAELVLRKRRIEAFDERIRSRVEAGAHIERMTKVRAMRARHQQDQQKKKEFERRKQQRELELKQKAETKWKRKVEEQKKQMAKEKFLQEQKKKGIELFKQQYMKAMIKEWTRMQEELNTRKCGGTLIKMKKDMRERSIKQIIKSVSEAYSAKKSLGVLSQDKETLDTLTDRVQNILRDIRYDLEPYIVIAHAKGRLEKQENVPLQVSGAIKFLLEQSIVEYTAKHLTLTVNNTVKKMLTAIDELKTGTLQSQQTEHQALSIKLSTLSGLPRTQSMSSRKTARISDITFIPMMKHSDELKYGVEDLRRTKDRIPTPMPSIQTLTEALFQETTAEEFEEDSFGGALSFIEQRKLISSINEVSNRISKMVPSRVRSVVESRSYDRLSVSVSVDESKAEVGLSDNKPVAKLCSLILFEDMVGEFDLQTVVDRMILGFMQDIQLTPSYLRLKIKQRLEAVK